MLEKGKTIDPDFGRENDDVLWFSASLGFRSVMSEEAELRYFSSQRFIGALDFFYPPK